MKLRSPGERSDPGFSDAARVTPHVAFAFALRAPAGAHAGYGSVFVAASVRSPLNHLAAAISTVKVAIHTSLAP
ncbi:hypothetical protein SSBR45G_27760 [Bradyrhizobium sp. SSBR45G]|nr:hypothetical protein SSBR45G_27760 [Bradyrhizobium sp. SSBR45G]GLH85510.1 hypothetical protein SSBR45R_29700 [Bradyrhizobium sp. SSBR45R]